MESKLSELHKDLLKTDLRYKNYNLFFLSQIFISDNYMGIYKRVNFIRFIKKLSFDNILKYITFKISTPFFKRSRGLIFDYLFINEINNKAMVESLHYVYKKFSNENVAEVISDIRLGKPDKRVINCFEFLNLKIFLISIIDYTKIFPEFIRMRKDINIFSQKYDISPFFFVLNFFDSILLINLVKKIFSQVKINKLVLMTDVHKLSRIFVLEAKLKSIPTFVLQHGATVSEHGYLPIMADVFLAWGKCSEHWLTKRKQPIEKIITIGSPRLDSVQYDMKYIPARKEVKKVLIVMNEETNMENYCRIIRDAFVKLKSNIEITVKLHPGGSLDYTFLIDKIYRNSGLNYKVLRFENINELLKNTDIVFVSISSVGIEAILYNIPIFQFIQKGIFSFKMSYEDFDCSHKFRESEEITKIFQAGEVFSKIRNYPGFVDYYFYKLDGNSALRAKEIITN